MPAWGPGDRPEGVEQSATCSPERPQGPERWRSRDHCRRKDASRRCAWPPTGLTAKATGLGARPHGQHLAARGSVDDIRRHHQGRIITCRRFERLGGQGAPAALCDRLVRRSRRDDRGPRARGRRRRHEGRPRPTGGSTRPTRSIARGGRRPVRPSAETWRVVLLGLYYGLPWLQ